MTRPRIAALIPRYYEEALTHRQERAVVERTLRALVRREQELSEVLGDMEVVWVVMYVPSPLLSSAPILTRYPGVLCIYHRHDDDDDVRYRNDVIGL